MIVPLNSSKYVYYLKCSRDVTACLKKEKATGDPKVELKS